MDRKIVALVGLPGSGKTEAARFFSQHGFKIIKFGDLTDKLIQDNKIEHTEHNEKRMREYLREKEGMEAYAKLHKNDIAKTLVTTNIVIDGLYSWEEYLFLKKIYKERLLLLAIYAPPPVRHLRLNTRHHRPLHKEEAISRDKEEIENLNVGGPIAVANHTIVNIRGMEDLRIHIAEFVKTQF
ncbi:AAA family ATPase [Candidatus Woesearchaeota archaeon]|jgi:dephospho-CoA kinase|nr:AAA family ATPase [Candidatus Woesearchaeota archaeon]MBT5271752.1 AAA family ATPase [Candidatus Woesearchaeota archaeon]MBT6041569.1 AAA family ATPase [Candidatus Woesearchaeota archaeon]MBT6337384.1 AAA family ATPase [Candidatus Woesearchaeota archaeon]MBT7927286.1 AAA family ATPase [Candidatus Woesearchaeota archaeon]